jgi:hypothetical protein
VIPFYQRLLLSLLSLTLSLLPSAYAQGPQSPNPKYWQTTGYGYVIEVIDDTMSFYDVTKNTCVKNRFASSDYENTLASRWITTNNRGNTELDWHVLHPIDLTPLNTLPQACQSAHQPDFNPIKNFDVFWSTYAEHFPYGYKQNWHWNERYPIWRSMITKETSEKQLASIFSLIINQVRDGHANLVNNEGDDIGDIEPRILAYEYRLRQSWKKNPNYQYLWPFVREQFRQWERIIVNNYAVDKKVTSYYDNFYFATLKNNISYLRIDSMMGFTNDESYDSYESWLNAVDDTMKNIMPIINKSSGLVIDLRSNGGGSDVVSLQLLSYLFESKTRIGAKATVVNGKLGRVKNIWISPSGNTTYDGPVVALTSQGTASAAEIMLIGLTARENTIIIGEPSYGSFSDILPKQLPNGWQLGLSHQVYLDVNGFDHEEIGIPVSEYVSFLFIEDMKEGKDIAIEKAITFFESKD